MENTVYVTIPMEEYRQLLTVSIRQDIEREYEAKLATKDDEIIELKSTIEGDRSVISYYYEKANKLEAEIAALRDLANVKEKKEEC